MNQEKLTEFQILQRKDAKKTMIVVDVVCVLLLLTGLYFGVRYFINESFLNDYEAEIYEPDKPLSLTKFNLFESFLPYYNLGNVYYQNEQYDKAIAAYNKALEKNPIGKRECPV
ncbi:MAG: tetratricopeptide repeat protein, partial [Lachnospiraceae bacterium]|nr:tetratricopeptide repeat protein [Lachnospiraceae bacterium]